MRYESLPGSKTEIYRPVPGHSSWPFLSLQPIFREQSTTSFECLHSQKWRILLKQPYLQQDGEIRTLATFPDVRNSKLSGDQIFHLTSFDCSNDTATPLDQYQAIGGSVALGVWSTTLLWKISFKKAQHHVLLTLHWMLMFSSDRSWSLCSRNLGSVIMSGFVRLNAWPAEQSMSGRMSLRQDTRIYSKGNCPMLVSCRPGAARRGLRGVRLVFSERKAVLIIKSRAWKAQLSVPSKTRHSECRSADRLQICGPSQKVGVREWYYTNLPDNPSVKE